MLVKLSVLENFWEMICEKVSRFGEVLFPRNRCKGKFFIYSLQHFLEKIAPFFLEITSFFNFRFLPLLLIEVLNYYLLCLLSSIYLGVLKLSLWCSSVVRVFISGCFFRVFFFSVHLIIHTFVAKSCTKHTFYAAYIHLFATSGRAQWPWLVSCPSAWI